MNNLLKVYFLEKIGRYFVIREYFYSTKEIMDKNIFEGENIYSNYENALIACSNLNKIYNC